MFYRLLRSQKQHVQLFCESIQEALTTPSSLVYVQAAYVFTLL